jgi:hypothetical protein
MRILAAAIMLGPLFACAGAYTDGSNPLNPPDGSAVGVSADGGDGGADAGGDGGVDAGPDAGCVAVSLNGLAFIDNCVGAQTGTASLSITDPAHGCAVSITLDNGDGPCTGVASGGSRNAFDGGCATIGYSCTAPSLPGMLLCKQGINTCTIEICDAGTCP